MWWLQAQPLSQAWILFPRVPLNSCLTLHKEPDLSLQAQFPHMQNKANKTFTSQGFGFVRNQLVQENAYPVPGIREKAQNGTRYIISTSYTTI